MQKTEPMGMLAEPAGTSDGTAAMTLTRAREVLWAYLEKLDLTGKHPERREAIAMACLQLNYLGTLEGYGSCNTCSEQRVCPYLPKPGDQVRINCAFYQGGDKTSKVRERWEDMT